MNQQTHHTIQAFVDQAIDQAVSATEQQYGPQVKTLEALMPTGNGAWAAYEKLSLVLAQEKGDVARAAFLTGLRYGLAMAHLANPSLFVQIAGVTE